MLTIEVVRVNGSTKRNVLASCQVELKSEDGEDVVGVLDARVLRTATGILWVAYPNQTYRIGDGPIRYAPVLHFSKALGRRISVAVLEAYNGPLGSKQRVKAYED